VPDICLVLEGTYPYVQGGVSTWVHNLIRGLPSLRFALVHIGPERGAYHRRRYDLPANVVSLTDLYCREPLSALPDPAALHRAAHAQVRRHAGDDPGSRVLGAFRRLHFDDRLDASLLQDLGSGDLSVPALLHSGPSLDLTMELCQRLAPRASFIDFFWHFRSMHLPLARLLAARAPAAGAYHALCTGYAGALAAVWSQATGRPLLLTEHGIYTRERVLELHRATWLQQPRRRRAAPADPRLDGYTVAALRRMWVSFFRALARCAYFRASKIVSLSEADRRRQISDGAPAERTLVVPNGVDIDRLDRLFEDRTQSEPGPRAVRVGFVGRLVPIKNFTVFIRSCALALRRLELEARVFGPLDEDPAYVRRCRRLVASLGLERTVHFLGPRPMEQIYPEIDILVLTSFSEGQPLVILEANGLGIPVIASDVGACRDLLEGREGEDRSFGPSGFLTRISAPEETAAAIRRLASDPALRRKMGSAGRRRVATCYPQSLTLSSYRELYAVRSWPASVGGSSD